jgi:hypothetical protein
VEGARGRTGRAGLKPAPTFLAWVKDEMGEGMLSRIFFKINKLQYYLYDQKPKTEN